MRRKWTVLFGVVGLVLSLVAASPVRADLVGVEIDTGNYFKVSETDASLTLIGPTALGLADIVLAPDGFLYGFTVGTAPNLYKIDPATGAAALVGPLDIVGGAIDHTFEGGLAIAADGTAYGVNAGPDQLHAGFFKIDLSTGHTTFIGNLSGARDINGLTFRSDGQLLGLDDVSNSLVFIDPATAAVTPFAPLATVLSSVGGLTIDAGVGYFATAGPALSIPGSNSLFSFDPFTGAATLVGSFAPTIAGAGISGLVALPGAPPVPEPMTLLLFGSGLACLGGLHRKRRRVK